MFKLLSVITGAAMICISSVVAQPDSNATAVLDDFENAWGDKDNQTNLGAVKGFLEKGPTMVHKGGGWWYSFFDELGSAVTSGDGVDTIGTTNAGAMIEEASEEDHFIHVWLMTNNSMMDYPYAGFGCLISGTEDGNIHDFSALTAITMRVKGDGFVTIRVETQDVTLNYDWGFYQRNIDLTSEWTEFSVPVDSLKPAAYSEPAEEGWTWDHGKTEATKISFQVKDGDFAELYIDDITLEGLKYYDFTPIQESYTKPIYNGTHLRVAGNTVIYKLASPQEVSLTVYDLYGRCIKNIVNRKDQVGEYSVTWNGLSDNGTGAASGLYFYRFKAGNRVWHEPFSFVK